MALPMKTPRFAAAALIALACLAAPHARAALFEDDEARKAILELRQRVEAQRKALESGIGEAMSAQAAEQRRQIEEQRRQMEELRRLNEEFGALMRRSLLDLANQIESLRSEIARLRGQDEQLARDVADVQRRQKDLAEASGKADERLRRLEPVNVSLDGKEFSADAAEKAEFETALATFRKGDFPLAQTAFADFLRRHGSSGYRPNALYWLGNAQYAVRDYKEAIGSFRAFLSAAPGHARAPDALLSVANCQIELKDLKAARKTLADVGTLYAQSEAAQAAKERLARLK
jgi:tol-pal system protein YbgF